MPSSRASSGKRGYGSRWRRFREAFLARNPWCVRCQAAGRMSVATVVDHIEPHRGDPALFWKRGNHQGLCATCHSGDKQREESGGQKGYRGCDADGIPLDPQHHWRDDGVRGESDFFQGVGERRPAPPFPALTRNIAHGGS